MKKLILFLTLLFVGFTSNAQYSPSNNLNYVKLLKDPPAGTDNDSIVVFNGTDKFIKMRPSSVWAKDADVVKKFIKSNGDLSLAQRKDDVLYGILDRYTGEQMTLSKVTGTPTVDGVIYFQFGSEYFKRNFSAINVKWFGALGTNSGDDSVEIQAALNYGGSIYLPKGTYRCTNEFEMISNSSFFGDGYDSQLHIIPSGSGQSYGLRIKNKSNCTISKIRVYGDGLLVSDLTSAIDIYGSNNCTVSGVFIDTVFLGIGCGNVSLTQSTGISITDNYISNIGLNGIYCNTFGDNNRVENNHISEFGILASASIVAAGIEYRGSGSGSCSGNIITNGNYGTGAYNDGLRIEFATEGVTKYPDFLNIQNNVIKNTNGHGIRLQFVKNCNVSNNIISDISYGNGILLLSDLEISEGNNISNNNISYVNDESGILLQGSATDAVSDNSINSNTIFDCKIGIVAYYSNENLIQNNHIYKNIENGISIYASSLNNIISNNKITDNTLIGILLSSSDKTIINNNTITGNGTQGINITSGATNTHLVGGVIYENTSGDVVDSSSTTTYSLAESNGNFKTNSIEIIGGSFSNFLKSNGSSNTTLTESGGSIIVGTDPSGLGKFRLGGDAWIGGNLLMPDSTFDIGNASHTGRPRNIYTNGLFLDNTSVSAGGYAFLTQNTSTLATEKVSSASIAPIASPALTGIPTAPTATVGTNTTQIATTAFVQASTASVASSIYGSDVALSSGQSPYTLLLTDANARITTNGSFNQNFSIVIPTNAIIPFQIGTKIRINCSASQPGNITLSGSGITFIGANMQVRYGGSFNITKVATNTWYVEQVNILTINSGNRIVTTGDSYFSGGFEGNFSGTSFIKTGGTSSQFLKADGSVDSNTYVTSASGVIAGSFTATGTATTTFTVTIGTTQANNTYKIVATGSNAMSAASFFISNKTTTTFDVSYLTALTGAIAFDWILKP